MYSIFILLCSHWNQGNGFRNPKLKQIPMFQEIFASLYLSLYFCFCTLSSFGWGIMGREVSAKILLVGKMILQRRKMNEKHRNVGERKEFQRRSWIKIRYIRGVLVWSLLLLLLQHLVSDFRVKCSRSTFNLSI